MAWLSSHSFRKKITIQNANIDSNLTDFPVYVDITDDADFHEARSDGYDIRFTQSDGTTLLKYEREYWTGGNGSNGTGHFWVKTNVTSASSTEIYCYYGDSDASDGEDATNVWDSNFQAVYHLKEASNPYYDSTGNNNDSTAGTYPTQIDGKVYKGQDFELDSSEYISIPDDASLDFGSATDFTITLWANIETLTDYSRALGKWTGNTGYNLYFRSAGNFGFHIKDGSSQVALSNVAGLSTNTWYHLGYTCDRDSSTGIQGWEGGAKSGGTGNPTSVGDISSASALMLGAYDSPSNYYDGILDEVRISSKVREDAWIKFEYYNINESDNELTWGSEEASGGSTFLPKVIFIQ